MSKAAAPAWRVPELNSDVKNILTHSETLLFHVHPPVWKHLCVQTDCFSCQQRWASCLRLSTVWPNVLGINISVGGLVSSCLSERLMSESLLTDRWRDLRVVIIYPPIRTTDVKQPHTCSQEDKWRFYCSCSTFITTINLDLCSSETLVLNA